MGQGSPACAKLLDILNHQCRPTNIGITTEPAQRCDEIRLGPPGQRTRIQIQHRSRQPQSYRLGQQRRGFATTTREQKQQRPDTHQLFFDQIQHQLRRSVGHERCCPGGIGLRRGEHRQPR